ncbi:NlpC/P60 family protein [Corynebacterium choanae]|uniref:Putative endopeptidase n=1 Tax=Corynebacterium choanae TaxID=1862358 RepID=A0A3G6JBD8_9CORY|nr:C40 family peptidase [Corynebacterium choanae]AZA13970.1 putative endopeptidase precursor [Corynebacterium choanae]
MKLSVRLGAAVFTATLLVIVCDPAVIPRGAEHVLAQAGADDIDALMEELAETSREVEAKNEEVKGLSIALERQQETVDSLTAAAAEAKQHADEALAAQDAARSRLDRVARAEYRTAFVDPITTVITADGPQTAIARGAFLKSMEQHVQQVIDEKAAITSKAAEQVNAAATAKAAADFAARELAARHEEVSSQRDELNAAIDDIRERIDGLDVQQRIAWAMRHDPQEYSLADVGGSAGEGLRVLSAAFTKLGAPYQWGATGPDRFDCSGFVLWSYAQEGIAVPRTSQAQMAAGTPVDIADLQPGDVIGFYPGATHVGIYAGNGMVIHASDYGIPVQVVPLDSMPFYGARRY